MRLIILIFFALLLTACDSQTTRQSQKSTSAQSATHTTQTLPVTSLSLTEL